MMDKLVDNFCINTERSYIYIFLNSIMMNIWISVVTVTREGKKIGILI